MRSGVTSPTRSLEILADGRPLEGVVLALDVLLATDRPDRLEVTVAGRPGAPVRRLAAGSRLEARAGALALFEGRADRVSHEVGPDRGPCVSVVAHPEYHRLRDRTEARTYFQVTDSEIASRSAALLELEAVVDPTDRVHAREIVAGDPLQDLRCRARSCGFQLAVRAGRLWFTREAPRIGVPRRVGRIERIEITDRGPARGGRGGLLVVPGEPSWLPLHRAEVEGLGGDLDGVFHVVRALHRIDATGYKTTLELLESGLDLALWQEGPGEDGHAS